MGFFDRGHSLFNEGVQDHLKVKQKGAKRFRPDVGMENGRWR